jgi:endonuclease-3 related protein
VSKALDNLKRAGVLDPQALATLPDDRLAALIRPSGFWRGKTRKIRAFMDLLSGEYGGDLDRLLALETAALRRTLLATHGIGPETADDIVLYAAGQPVFVVDAYTRRIFARLGYCPPTGRYDDLQSMFMRSLPPDAALFGEYHALLVRLGKTTCTKAIPRCLVCPLRDICPTGSGNSP